MSISAVINTSPLWDRGHIKALSLSPEKEGKYTEVPVFSMFLLEWKKKETTKKKHAMLCNVSGVIHAVTSLQEFFFFPTVVKFVLFPSEIYLRKLNIS